MFIFLVPHQCCRRVFFHLGIACITCFNTPLAEPFLYAIVALSMLAVWPCFRLENACLGAALLLYFHSMSTLCIHCIAIGHFGCLNSHFGTIPCIWCHFAIFRDCFPPYFSAEIPLACLHIIFYVISCLNAIASVCVPVCTHFEASHFHPSASYVSVAEAHSC